MQKTVKSAAGMAMIILLGLMASGTAAAESMTVNGYQNPYLDEWGNVYNDYEYSAQASFELSGSVLTVTLTNTSTQDVDAADEVLTGLLFSVSGQGTLAPVSASVLNWSPNNSQIVYWDGSNPNAYSGSSDGTVYGDISSEWAFNGVGLSSAAYEDISGDQFTEADLMGLLPGNQTLWAPNAPNGIPYGILPLADDPNTVGADSRVDGGPLVRGGVVFTFEVSEFFTLEDIQNISFQYGVGVCDPNIPPAVPEPASMTLLGIGVAAMALRKRFAQR